MFAKSDSGRCYARKRMSFGDARGEIVCIGDEMYTLGDEQVRVNLKAWEQWRGKRKERRGE